MKNLKTIFTEDLLLSELNKSSSKTLRVLDIGCGTVGYIVDFLREHPEVTYVGLEPIASSYKQACKNTRNIKNISVHFGLAYGFLKEVEANSFDIVFSQSVLEHVKHLEKFIEFSAQRVKVGGIVMHRYDLGHALYPHSIKERLHVWLGNNLPILLSETNFVSYVSVETVKSLYQKFGLDYLKTTYHQMPNHKSWEKISEIPEPIRSRSVSELAQWESNNQEAIGYIPQKERELLFPAVAVYGRRLR